MFEKKDEAYPEHPKQLPEFSWCDVAVQTRVQSKCSIGVNLGRRVNRILAPA